MAEVIQIDASRATIALGKFRASLAQRGELMKAIGLYMMGSVARTFRQEGSPEGSWPRLAPSTIKSDPSFYGEGHKLLIGRTGRLFQSIHAQSDENQAVIGTNLVYARVHQFGSRDRGAVFGPRTAKMEAATVNVKQHGFARLARALGKGRLGNSPRNIKGPRNQIRGTVSAHTRHQNIPARPYLVFRPEDPERIQSLVNSFVRRAQAQAGLGGAE
jgi:phage virion morphogenesis protein